ncbi:MAG: hypothetical protein ACYC0V_00655 [Armatimonadota bacterium]
MTARIPVFYDRELKPEWIDYALEQFVQSSNAQDMKQTLRQRLSNEIECATSLRKIISQLEQTVGYRSQLSREKLIEIYSGMSKVPSIERNPMRIRILIDSNKFIADCLSAIQKIHRLGVDGIEAKELYERIEAIYGERGTIPRRIRYVLRTLANMGILEKKDRKWFVITDI